MEKLFINLTQHNASAEQLLEGEWVLKGQSFPEVRELLTFNDIPNKDIIKDRANKLAQWALSLLVQVDPDHNKEWYVLIGGAPYLMSNLENTLNRWSTPVYSFSKRESIETLQSDGSVVKTSIFKHVGFIEA